MTNKKSKIPYIFFIFFAVILAVNICYIYISQTTWRGVLTENSYQKGLAYNQVILSAEKQNKLGWMVKISYQKIDKSVDLFTVDLKDKNNKIINDAVVYATFKRPTQEGFDLTQKMEFIDQNYQTKVILPLKGQWDILIKITKNDDVFQEEKRYIMR